MTEELKREGAWAVAAAERVMRRAASGAARLSARMQLVVAIVQDEDVAGATDALTRAGFGVTRIESSGGFLRKGNGMLVPGVEPERVCDALRLLRRSCATRTDYSLPLLNEISLAQTGAVPTPVQVGGATVFVLNVDRYERL